MKSTDTGRFEVTEEFSALWREVMARTPRAVREKVAAQGDTSAVALADAFYSHMLEHERAKVFLDNEMVDKRLRASMARWVRQLFATLDEHQIPGTIAQQLLVGAVHARINLPADLMQVGFHVVARELRTRCAADFPGPDERFVAMAYLMDVFHITDSLMLASFVRDIQARARKEEAYRLISMEHDVALERERQRAALSEWVNQFLMSIRFKSRAGAAGLLGKSEFGLWMKHKAPMFFEGVPDIEHVFDVMRTVDVVYVPQLVASGVDDEAADRLVTELERRIEFIRYLVNDLFARLNKIVLGRDTVTRLLNQRYLPTILSQEIASHADARQSFSVVLIRVDAIHRVVPAAEPEGRDRLYQQIATTVVDSIRAGDHTFRYGEDEFLVVQVESDLRRAAALADDIRLSIRMMEFHLTSRTARGLTVSIGVAQFDGHPDYHYLLRRVETAADHASRDGGDRVVTN